MPSVPRLDWALWIIDCYSCWSDQRITTTALLRGWSTTSADALYLLSNIGLLFHLLVMVQASSQEERDPRDRKREAERGEEIKRSLRPDGFRTLPCWCQRWPAYAKDKLVLITLHQNKLSIVTLGHGTSVHFQWSKSEHANEHMLICTWMYTHIWSFLFALVQVVPHIVATVIVKTAWHQLSFSPTTVW